MMDSNIVNGANILAFANPTFSNKHLAGTDLVKDHFKVR